MHSCLSRSGHAHGAACGSDAHIPCASVKTDSGLCLQAAALLTQEMRVLPVIKDAFVSVLGVSDMVDILSLTEEVIDGVLHTLDQKAFGEFPIPDARVSPGCSSRVRHRR